MCSHSLNISVSFLARSSLWRMYSNAIELRNGYITCFSQRSDVGHFSAEFWESGHHLPCHFLSVMRGTMLQMANFSISFGSRGRKKTQL